MVEVFLTRASLLGPVLLLLLAPAFAWAHSPQSPAASSVVITHEIHTPLDGHFTLVDQNGRSVSDRDFRGSPMLVYFGYTNCPDVCPLDAQTIGRVTDILDARGERMTPIFITVDPERDTPDRLGAFLAPFHPRFVGLTGPAAEVRRVAAAYGAEDDRINERSPSDYDVLHPAIAYLMGRNGEFIDLIRLSDAPATIADSIAARLLRAR